MNKKIIIYAYVPAYVVESPEWVDGQEEYHTTWVLSSFDRDKHEWVESEKKVDEPIELPELDSSDFFLPEEVVEKLGEWKKQGIIVDYDTDAPYDSEFTGDSQFDTWTDGDAEGVSALLAVQITLPEENERIVEEWFDERTKKYGRQEWWEKREVEEGGE